jgi:D-arabinose 1-dehydrogenase-like Zn-dependent alcohol dehydrogenase
MHIGIEDRGRETPRRGRRRDLQRLLCDEEVRENSFGFILDIVCAVHDLNAYLPLLKRDAVYCPVGLPDQPPVINMGNLLFKRRAMSGFIIGGMAETQQMLD